MSDFQILYGAPRGKECDRIARELRDKGISVIRSATPERILQTVEQKKTTVVLCDWHLKEIDCHELLRSIKKLNPSVAFIAIIEYEDLSLAVRFMREGAYDVLGGSVDTQVILRSVKSALRHQKAEKVRISDDLVNMLIRNVPDIIYSLNPKGEFISLSDAVYDTLGYRPEELIGKSVFTLIHESDREKVLHNFRLSVESNDQQVKTLQFRMITKDGQAKDFEISRKLYFENGRVVRNDGIARDVTERNLLERELRRYSQDLEKSVEERTQKLEYAKKQLEALNQVSNRFAQIFDEETLLQEVPRLLTESLDFDRAVLILKENDRYFLKSSCFGKDSPEILKDYLDRMNLQKAPPPSYLRKCVEGEEVVFIEDVNELEEWPEEMKGKVEVTSLVAAPVKVKDQVIAIIEGDMQYHTRQMDRQDVARFEMFANMVGLALDNIRAYQQMERRVEERTRSLNETNERLKEKANELQRTSLDLAQANVDLLAIQEEMEEKNKQMANLVTEVSRSKDVLQSILDSSRSVIVMVDTSNKVIAVNQMAEVYFRISSEHIIGKPFDEFIGSIRTVFEDPEKLLGLVSSLTEKPDVLDETNLNVEEVYNRALKLSASRSTYVSIFSSRVNDQQGTDLGQVWSFIDITPMKMADEKLRTIVEASPIPFVITRMKDGKVLYANRPLADLMGVTPEEALENYSLDFYANPEDRQEIIELIQQEGQVRDYELQFRKKSGDVVWMIMSLIPSELDGEGVFVGALYDINERIKTEEALRRERNFVSAILDTSGALVVVLDTQGRVVRVNKACENLTGWTLDEVRGRVFWELFILPEEMEAVKKTFNNLKAGQFPNEFENYWLSREGERFRVTWSNTVLLDDDGNVEYVIGTGIDITERKKAEEKLRLYREIFLNSNDGIAVFDANGLIMERNPVHRRNTGLSDEEIAGKTYREFIGENYADAITVALAESGSYRGEIESEARDGKRIFLDLSIFTLYKKDGDIDSYVGIARDITERKKAEAALRNAHADLERRVEERTRELAELNEMLLEEIDERKHTENALKESESQVRALLRAIPDLIFRMNREGEYLDYQAPVGSVLAIPREKVVGRKITETLPPDLAEKTFNSIMTALNTSEMQILEYQMPHEQELHDFEARIVVSGRDEVLAIVRDITDQKRAKEALQRARDELEVRVKERTAELAEANLNLRGEISERVQAEKTLENRLLYEEGLARCSEALLRIDDMKLAMNTALEALMEAASASRVYLFENSVGDENELLMSQSFEVCAPGVKSEIDNPLLQNLPYGEDFGRWQNVLAGGEAIAGVVRDFPAGEREILESQDIQSILILPVMTEGRWYGFVGFDDIKSARIWAADDVRLLQTAAEMIGGFIGKKRAEEALRVSEERFRSLVENAHDIIYSMKPDGTFSYLSPQFTKFTGYAVEEFLGKPLRPLIHPDDYSATSRNIEFRIIRKDGSWRWFTMHSTHIRDENGNILETIGIAHDVTEMKRVLENLEKTNEELRDTQLQLIQSEKMASLGMLVAGIAHEINTPVGAISSMHNTMVRATGKLRQEVFEKHRNLFQSEKNLPKLFGAVEDANRVIKTATDRVTNIVRRLRSFARLDEAELKEANIHEGIEDTLTIVHHELKHTVKVTRNYGDIPVISCYPGRLNQVFLNVLINARQAIVDKGEITITTFTKEKKVYIQFQDTGVGIRKEDIPKIFDPGFTTKGVGVGTGLGLSIVYQIIRDHQGEIKVDSEPGRGTTFTIILPLDLEERLHRNRKE